MLSGPSDGLVTELVGAQQSRARSRAFLSRSSEWSNRESLHCDGIKNFKSWEEPGVVIHLLCPALCVELGRTVRVAFSNIPILKTAAFKNKNNAKQSFCLSWMEQGASRSELLL